MKKLPIPIRKQGLHGPIFLQTTYQYRKQRITATIFQKEIRNTGGEFRHLMNLKQLSETVAKRKIRVLLMLQVNIRFSAISAIYGLPIVTENSTTLIFRKSGSMEPTILIGARSAVFPTVPTRVQTIRAAGLRAAMLSRRVAKGLTSAAVLIFTSGTVLCV